MRENLGNGFECAGFILGCATGTTDTNRADHIFADTQWHAAADQQQRTHRVEVLGFGVCLGIGGLWTGRLATATG